MKDWTLYDRPRAARHALSRDGVQATAQLAIHGMHCGACALKIERKLSRVPGVTRAAVNGATQRMLLSWDLSQVPFSRLLKAIADLGFTPEVLGASHPQAGVQERRTALKRLGVAGIAMAQVMSFAFALYSGDAHGIEPQIAHYLRLVSMLVATPVVLYSAAPFFAGAWRDLNARRLSMDTPVCLAIALAFTASVFNTLRGAGEVYYDSVTMFVFLLLLARWVQMQTRHRCGSVSEALADSLPQQVRRRRGDHVETIRRGQLHLGDRIIVPTGALIAADGRVVEGGGAVDESLLTGESTAIAKRRGDAVLGGSLNVGDPLEVEVTALESSTVLAGIGRLVEQAQTTRPRIGHLADRAATYFVAAMLLVALAVAGAWLLLDPARAFSSTLAVLVVTCPCALSLATPTALAAATTRLARMGLLITHPDAIEALAQARHCVFDKTGTLTEGAPRLVRTRTLSQRTESECLAIAALLERQSEHPLAAAFTSAAPAPAELLSAENRPLSQMRVVRGQGVEAQISQEIYRIGQLDFVLAASGCAGAAPPLDIDLNPADIYLGNSSGLLAAFEIDAALRPGAASAVAALAALGIQSEIASGDHADTVRRVADQIGIRSWGARLTPETKLERIRELNRLPGGVIMIGDGVNDAPVLGAARASIAMGGGCALAHASADAVLMSPSLLTIADAVRTARHTLAVIRQNLWWAAGYNLLAVPLAAIGAVPPWAAAIGMSVSSMFVALNAARLSRDPPARQGACPTPASLCEAGS